MNPNEINSPSSRAEAFQRLGELEQELRGLMREIHRNREVIKECLAERNAFPIPKECYKSVTTA